MDSAKEARLKQSEKIIKLMEQIQAIQERIYTVRYDKYRDEEDVRSTIEKLVSELKILETDFNVERKKQIEMFENSLNLSEIGLPSHIITKPESKTQSQQPTKTEEQKDKEQQTASSRWKKILSMLKESGREAKIAKGQYLIEKSDQTDKLVDDEIAQVRAAIFALRQKKKLAQSEEDLLASLQKRLKALWEAKKLLVSGETV